MAAELAYQATLAALVDLCELPCCDKSLVGLEPLLGKLPTDPPLSIDNSSPDEFAPRRELSEVSTHINPAEAKRLQVLKRAAYNKLSPTAQAEKRRLNKIRKRQRT
jgi:hypothetical protein